MKPWNLQIWRLDLANGLSVNDVSRSTSDVEPRVARRLASQDRPLSEFTFEVDIFGLERKERGIGRCYQRASSA
jgi:hypothetical protein